METGIIAQRKVKKDAEFTTVNFIQAPFSAYIIRKFQIFSQIYSTMA